MNARTRLALPVSAFLRRRQWLAGAGVLIGAAALGHAPLAAAAAPLDPGGRVVSLHAGLTGDLLALGLPLAATATQLPGASRHPKTRMPVMWRAAMAKLPAAPAALPDNVTDAALAELKPSLIVLDARQPGMDAARLEKLRAIASLLVVDRDFGTWQERLGFIAAALGRQAQDKTWLDGYQAALQDFAQSARMPEGARWDVLQMNGQDMAGDPYAISPASPLGRLLAEAGFKLDDTAAKLPGAGQPDALGRVPAPLAQLKQVITAPWALLLNNGPQIASQVCCTPAWQEIPTITSYQRHELAEHFLQPDAISAPRLLETLKELLATRAQ